MQFKPQSFSLTGLLANMTFFLLSTLLYANHLVSATYNGVLPYEPMARPASLSMSRSERSVPMSSKMELNLLFGRQETCPSGEHESL